MNSPPQIPENYQALPEQPDVLLTYQQDVLASTAIVIVWEKSRRIGASWCLASLAVLTASASRKAGGEDVMYVGFNLDMAKEFIDDCAFWAKHLADFSVEEIDYDDVLDGDPRAIKALRITFVSGFEVLALSSKPRSLRGRQGLVILDEAAFHDDLPGMIKSAMALTIWGSRVIILSTHFGEDNPFNELVQDCRAGKLEYQIFRTTFDEAVEAGLYKRICYVKGWEWSAEAEIAWNNQIRGLYGEDAAEELDVVPSKGTGVYITGAMIDKVMNPHHIVVRLRCEKGFELKPVEDRTSFVKAWLEQEIDPLLAQLNPRQRSFFGEDFGRSGDLTVISVGQEGGNSLHLQVPFMVELRNTPFAQQQEILFHIVERLPRFANGKMDARGNGQQLAEATADKFGHLRIEQVMLTQKWYLENMPRLKARIEGREIELPKSADVKNDLRLIKMQNGIAQIPATAKSKGEDGGQRHGDAAISIAMLEAAFRAEVAEYDYEAAPRARSKFAGPSDWNEQEDDRDTGSGWGGGGATRGAW